MARTRSVNKSVDKRTAVKKEENGQSMSNNQPPTVPYPNQQQVNMKAPEEFDFMKPETWPTWEKRFLRFISVAKLSCQTSKDKIDWLCYTMGRQSEEILLKILPNAESKPFDKVLKAFRDYFIPEKNIILERFKFNSRFQLPDESIDAFISALYSLAEKCDYSTTMEDMIRDRIVVGIRDSKTSDRLKLKSNLTLATAITEARQSEMQGPEAGESSLASTSDSLHERSLTSHMQREICPASNTSNRKRRQYEHPDEVSGPKKLHQVSQEDSLEKGNEDVKFCSNPNLQDSGVSSPITTSVNPPKIIDIDNSVLLDSDTFANSFFKVLADSNPGNLIVSPLSAEILLAMAAYGAGGDNATQMRTGLQLPEDDNSYQLRCHSLLRKMNAEDKVELHIANKIFIAPHVTLKPAYKKLTIKNFLSSPQHVDFENPRAAVNVMNTWCGKQTNNRITNIFQPGSFPPDTVFVLVNAVYFKGQWMTPFEKYRTGNRPFRIDVTTTKLLPIMKSTDYFRFGNIPKLDASFIEMPYKGETLSMIIILPNKLGGLKKVYENLHELNFKDSLQGVHRKLVELSVPKFKIECTFDLESTLTKLGMTAMFGGAADFSGITDVPLNVVEVIQTAFIEVNETGTEAYAITRMCGGGGPPPKIPEFRVDQPFYFSIYHHETGVSLFSGIVKEPAYA